mmetsp:Transcript_22030/g.44174  ORF Transcript_22030/g.44174 Transcript_22030/m.44174 type:complete len:245 (+) Transcript_22030:15-749(+)
MLVTFSRTFSRAVASSNDSSPRSSLRSNKELTILLRLGHQYGPNEDAIMSQPVQINLANIFSLTENTMTLVEVVEKTLSGNQRRSDWEKRKLNWNKKNSTDQRENQQVPLYGVHDNETTFHLEPLQIRTFEIRFALDMKNDHSAQPSTDSTIPNHSSSSFKDRLKLGVYKTILAPILFFAVAAGVIVIVKNNRWVPLKSYCWKWIRQHRGNRSGARCEFQILESDILDGMELPAISPNHNFDFE